MRAWLLGLSLAAAVAAPAAPLPPGYAGLDYTPPAAGSYRLPPLGQAADGPVLDEQGRPATLHQVFGGQAVLLGFIYTHCSDANGCPLATHVLMQVHRRAQRDPALRGRLRLVSLSFDPERDTPAVMRAYRQALLGQQGADDWRFLTTADEATLAPLLRAYGQYVQRDPGDGEDISHTLRVYLIDPQARIRNIYSAAFLDADLLLNDLRTVLAREDGDEAAPVPDTPPIDLLAHARHPPPGLPPVPEPADNPLTAEKIALGRRLFFDRRLSLNGTLSCAMCHVPAQGFTSHELKTAVGIEGRSVRRNTPTVLNSAYLTRVFHDGRDDSLEQQVWGPLLARNEMGMPSVGTVLRRLRSLPGYPAAFRRAFPKRGLTMETLGMALASYERTLIAGDSPFDRWYYGHDEQALDPAARRGFRLFTGKAGCSACHTIGKDHALFTDDSLRNTGIGYRAAMGGAAKTRVQLAPGVFTEVDAATLARVGEPPPADLGYYEITQDPADRWKYKVPGLRNVALTAPYMHDGSLATLAEVVAFYNAGGVPNENLDPLIHPLGLSQAEQADLVAFLEALTSPQVAALVRDAEAAPVGDFGVPGPRAVTAAR